MVGRPYSFRLCHLSFVSRSISQKLFENMLQPLAFALLAAPVAGHGWLVDPVSKNDLTQRMRNYQDWQAGMPEELRYCPDCSAFGNNANGHLDTPAANCGATSQSITQGLNVWQKWYDAGGIAITRPCRVTPRSMHGPLKAREVSSPRSTTCLLPFRVQVAWVWVGGSGRLETLALMPTTSEETRRPSRLPKYHGREVPVGQEARLRPSSLASISRSQGPLRLHQRQHQPHHSPHRHLSPRRRQRPRHQRRRLWALGSVAMGDAEEAIVRADGAVRARAIVKGIAMASFAQVQQRSALIYCILAVEVCEEASVRRAARGLRVVYHTG